MIAKATLCGTHVHALFALLARLGFITARDVVGEANPFTIGCGTGAPLESHRQLTRVVALATTLGLPGLLGLPRLLFLP